MSEPADPLHALMTLPRDDMETPDPAPATVTALYTLQWAYGGLLDAQLAPGYDVCLVTAVAGGGTPGPTLCGRDRFAAGVPGWSVGGGIYGPDVHNEACPECVTAAAERYPGVPVKGMRELLPLFAELHAAGAAR